MEGSSPEIKYKILFLPDNIEISVDKGANLYSAAIAAGVHINASCGGTGVCGTCKVLIKSGLVNSSPSGKIQSAEYDQGFRLACKSTVNSDLTVFIPVESRLDRAVRAIESRDIRLASIIDWKFDPPYRKYYLELPIPTLEDNSSDVSRITRELQRKYNLDSVSFDFDVIRDISSTLRNSGWKITANTITDPQNPQNGETTAQRIFNIEGGDTRNKHFAVAIDVGTTTVCGQLLDLNRGKIVSETIVFNKQISFGSDVITRIAFSQKPGGLSKIQKAVVASINEVIEDLLNDSQIERNDIGYLTAAGNTTMTQLLLGLDSNAIRIAPYIPVANYLPSLKASEFGINIAKNVYLYTFPSVSSYVGGDIVSGVIAAGIHQTDKLTFFMDVGTNGEIVIGNKDWLVTASCSAGPAFEGGGIKCGMVAMKGAIQDFGIDSETFEPAITTIGDCKPKGICGSGLINAIAGFLETGVIDRNGKFNSNISSSRIRQGADGYEYVLSFASETQNGSDLVITEVDIANLIRAKAAMYAGFRTLSQSVNINISDFEEVIIAGNFGSSLNIDKAITIGLLPDLPREKFSFIGNSSLKGARIAAFSTDVLNDSRKVGEMMTNIELSENNSFNDNYTAALFLPHTDDSAFPTVMKKLI